MVATARITSTAQIVHLYSPRGANVHPIYIYIRRLEPMHPSLYIPVSVSIGSSVSASGGKSLIVTAQAYTASADIESTQMYTWDGCSVDSVGRQR